MAIFLTILSGVLVYVIGQVVLKILLEPVQEMRRSIGNISHSLLYYANIIANPGVTDKEKIDDASTHLRSLSSEIQSHLYLVPMYDRTARLFRLPNRDEVMDAAKMLIGLSNSLHTAASENIYEKNAKRVAKICDALDIYLPNDERWPDDA